MFDREASQLQRGNPNPARIVANYPFGTDVVNWGIYGTSIVGHVSV